jgi:hypothetical protein
MYMSLDPKFIVIKMRFQWHKAFAFPSEKRLFSRLQEIQGTQAGIIASVCRPSPETSLDSFHHPVKISTLHHRRKPHSKTKGNKTVEYGFKGTQAWGRAQHRLCVQSPVLCSYLPDGPKCFEVSGLRKMNSFSMLSSCLQILPPSREFVSLWRNC